jgi:hypothetical protein
MEFYYTSKWSEYAEDEDELNELIELFGAYPLKYNYLRVSWADTNAWSEWRTVNAANVDPNSLEVAFDYYDEKTEEYKTIYYNQSLGEVEVRQVAVETFYPYNIATDSYQFELSQNYSKAIDLGIVSIEGYYFNQSKVEFDEIQSSIIGGSKIEIVAPEGFALSNFEVIVVLFNFTSGAYSDYSQFRLTQAAISNHNESLMWTINDSIYVEYEYFDLDYFLLFEDYDLSSEDTQFENISCV